MLRYSVTFAGSVLLAHLFSARLLRAATEDYAQQSPSAADLLASMRAKFNAVPMETQKLADNITMFDGTGGAVVVLNGPDGKFMVDTFVAPAWPKLKEALDGIGNAPVKYVIDTHWHFDHTDNNAHLHATGATVLAHENTGSGVRAAVCRSCSGDRRRAPGLHRSSPAGPFSATFPPVTATSQWRSLAPNI